RSPDLLAVNDIMIVALAARCGAQRERIGARGRLGYAESLQAEFATCDQRQIALFLSCAAVTQDRPHGVHLRVTGSAISTGSVHPLKNGGSSTELDPTTAVFFGNQRGKVTRFRQRGDEFGRITAVAIQRAPVFSGKLGAKRAHTIPNVGKLVVVGGPLFH